MGMADAKKDGVRVADNGKYRAFYPRCFFCQNEIEMRHYLSSRRYVCSACKPLIKTFRSYYDDRTSRSLFEAISREQQLNAAQKEREHHGVFPGDATASPPD